MIRPRTSTYRYRQFISLGVAVTFGLLLLSVFATTTFAQFTPEINYQGKLNDSAGVPVSDGSYSVAFRLYTTASGGSAIWSETVDLTLSNGLFSHLLGSSSTISGVDFNQPLYLGVEVEGDGEMTPRKQLAAVPAAFEARNAQTLDNIATSSFLRGDIANTASALLSFAGGFVSTASSTVSELNTSTTTVTTFVIDGQEYTSISGGSTGLTNNGGTLTANISESNLNITGSPTDDYILVASSTASGGFAWVASSTIGAHDAVTLAGTPDYLTLSGQEITLGTVDIGDDTNLTVGATGLELSDDDLVLSTGYAIPLTASTSNWNSFYDTPSTRITAGTGLSWSGNTLNAEVQSSDLASFGSDNQIPYTNSGGDDFDYSSNFTFDGSTLSVQTTGSTDILNLFETGGSEVFTVLESGNVGIGTTSPSSRLTVAGDTYFGGTLRATGTVQFDALTSPTSGLLLTDASGVLSTTSTSTLGLGDGTFLGLSDTPGSYTADRILFTSGSAVTSDADFTFDSGIGAFTAGFNPAAGNIIASGNGSLATGHAVGNNGSYGATSDIVASGNGSIAGGYVDGRKYLNNDGSAYLKATGLGSIALGHSAGDYNVGVATLESSGTGSFAMGYASSSDLIASGTAAFAFGENVNATADNAFSLGKGFTNSTASSFGLGFGSQQLTLLGSNGNLGIGTTSPVAKLSLTDGAFLASGTTGSTPISGAGTRMMWVPEKAAFRAGAVTGTVWDDANVGSYSVAFGKNTEANDEGAFAVGLGGDSSGSGSFAGGVVFDGSCGSIKSTGDGSFAFGHMKHQPFTCGLAKITATNDGSVAMGYSHNNTSDGSGIIESSGTGAIAMGAAYGKITASGIGSFAVGYASSTTLTATGQASVALGENVNATANNAFSLGRDFTNNDNDSFAVGFGSQQLTLTNGNLGLGTTTPAKTLSVSGDALITGALYDNSYSAGTNGMVLQSDGSGFNWVATSSLGFGSGDGTVTSVDMSVPTGLAISGNPITDSGTLALTYDTGYAAVLTASTTNWNTFYDTPSNRITDGNALTWSGNTLNFDGGASPGGELGGTWASPTIDDGALDDQYLVNDANDTTTGTLTANSFELGDGDYIGIGSAAERLQFNTAGTMALLGGDIGINTATPSSTLDVWGDFRVGTSSTPLLLADTAAQTISIGTTSQSSSFNWEHTTDTTGNYTFMDINAQAANVAVGEVVGLDLDVDSNAFAANARALDVTLNGGSATIAAAKFTLATDASSPNGVWIDTTAATGGFGLYMEAGNNYGTFVRNDGSSPTAYFNQAGTGDILQLWDDSTEVFSVIDGGNVGIGDASPAYLLTVGNGDLFGVNSSGMIATQSVASSSLAISNWQNGYVMQASTTASNGFDWVATSTLGISGGSGVTTFTGLTDTQGSLSANRLIFTNGAGDALTDSADLTFDGTNLSLGVSNGVAVDGTRVFFASTTDNTVLLGERAGRNLQAGATNNIAIGSLALDAATSVSDNVAIGSEVLKNLTTGTNNVYIGKDAGLTTTNATGNVAIGNRAMTAHTGERNFAMGAFALAAAGSGNDNVVIGYEAGSAIAGNAEGNFLLGYRAGQNLNDGDHNILIGRRTGDAITDGNDNIVLGRQSGIVGMNSNNILIGYSLETPATTTSNYMSLGNLIFGTGVDGTGSTPSSGNVGIGTTSPVSKLDVWGDLRVGTSSTPSLFVDTGLGNIGVGTSNPTSELHVYDNSTGVTPALTLQNDVSSGNTAINFLEGAFTNFSIVNDGADNQLEIDTYDQDNAYVFDRESANLILTRIGSNDSWFTLHDGGSNVWSLGRDDSNSDALTFSYSATLGTNDFMTVLTGGNVGIGDTSPAYLLTVGNGDLFGVNSSGMIATQSVASSSLAISNWQNGYVLQASTTAANGFDWVATSTLGIGGGGGSSLTVGSDNQIPYTNSGGDDFEYSGNFVFDGTNLGIGTSSPLAKLDVYGGASGVGTLNAGADELLIQNSGDAGMTIAAGNANLSAIYFADSGSANAGGLYYDHSADSLGFGVNNGTRLFIDSAGNTGIGDTSPDAHLEVSADGTSGGAAFYVSASDAGDGDLLSVLESGNVGIGDANPNRKLRVEGDSSSGEVVATFINTDTTASAFSLVDIQQTDAADSVAALRVQNDAETWMVGVDGANTDSFSIQNRNAGNFTNAEFVIETSGNVGIGTTTPSSIFAVANTGFSGAGTIGQSEYLTTANSVASALQLGREQLIDVSSNTATTSMVGNMIKVTDGTTYGNTVRGLEVQADLGGNTQGENTGISSFARTFGVRAYTSADAGGSFAPAAGFFETGGSSQGNAIRAYSSSITTSELLSLFQDTTDFAGTGLQMNFGNNSGSFSSSTSRFVDFQIAGTSKFTVSAHGTTTIGDGTTNNVAGLQIGYGGLCVDNDGSCNASTTGTISAVKYETGNSDLAEMYFSSEALQPGELVMSDGFLSIERAERSNGQVLGVVSTKPGLTLGADDSSLVPQQTRYPLALTGRVPVRLSTENGEIAVGDPLTLSSIPGVAMKATGADTIVGYALEAFDGAKAYTEGYINQFGDDIAEPDYEAARNHVRQEKAACYFGGGGAMGATTTEDCNPDAAATSSTIELSKQQEAEARYQAEQEALAALRHVPAERRQVDGATVRVGQVVMFVNHGITRSAEQSQILDELTSTSTDLVLGADEGSDETLWSRLKVLAQNFVNGVLTVTGITTEKVETKELCVDGVCVTGDELRALLEQASAPTTPPEPEPEPATVDDSGVSDSDATPTEPVADSATTSEESTETLATTTSSSSGSVGEVATSSTVVNTGETEVDSSEPTATTSPADSSGATDVTTDEPVVTDSAATGETESNADEAEYEAETEAGGEADVADESAEAAADDPDPVESSTEATTSNAEPTV